MINILIVDDEKEYIDIFKIIIEKYFNLNNHNLFSIDISANRKRALELITSKNYSLIFLNDIMPMMRGIELLDIIKTTSDKEPYICMLSTNISEENHTLYKNKGASSYILKPFKSKTIFLMLETFITPLLNKEIENLFEFDEFDDFSSMSKEEKNLMEIHNNNHKKISAIEFLKDFENLEYVLEDIYEIDELLKEIIESLSTQTFEHYKINIQTSLSLYTSFLISLSSLDDLANVLKLTEDVIDNLDLNTINIKKQEYIIETIRAILQDLVNWKDTVFIYKEAIDVFYIGASSYNSYLILKDLTS